MAMAAILVMWPRRSEQTFVPPAVSEKMFENGGRGTDDEERTTKPTYTIA